MQALSDEQLRDKTKEYKQRLAEGETLDDLLPEAFATVRELSLIHIYQKIRNRTSPWKKDIYCGGRSGTVSL